MFPSKKDKDNPTQQDVIDFFEMALNEAKEGRITGFAGCIIYPEYDEEGPAVGTIFTSQTKQNHFFIVGALAQLQFRMIHETEVEKDESR